MRYELKLSKSAIAELGKISDGDFARKHGGTRVTVCNARMRLRIPAFVMQQDRQKQPRSVQLGLWLFEGQREDWKKAAKKDKVGSVSAWIAGLADKRIAEQNKKRK